MFEKTI